MRLKTLLLGSAAALAAFNSARAADAVVIAEPEPVEYVRVCDVYGAGFYYIPGTETCLRVGGYLRYDIGVGDLLGRDVDGDGDGDSYYKRARASLQLDARSETELGTLRGFMHINANYDTLNNGQIVETDDNETPLDPSDDFDVISVIDGGTADRFVLEFAYIELGGFRVGKNDSLFSTMTNYAGGVINDDLVPYGPFSTHQIAYTYTGANGFSAAVALEEGSGSDTLEDYIPHVVAGVAFTQGWGGVSAVVGYDSQNEEFAGKVRLDIEATETVSLFIMGGYKTDDGDLEENSDGISDGDNYYGNWQGGDDDEAGGGDGFAVWGGGTVKLTEKANFNAQLSYDEGENFAAVANVAYELVPGFKVTPEVAYLDNFDDEDGEDEDGAFGGFLRFQRNF